MNGTSYHLAIDIGASGGRHILGHSVNGALEPVLSVYTSYPDARPADVEQNVTVPLERALASTKGLTGMTSSSSFQSSSINLKFTYGTDMDKKVDDIQSVVSCVNLPDSAGSPTVRRFERHILGHSVNGALELEEVHRFVNAPVKQGAALVWDTERLFAEIVAGIKKCAALGKVPTSIGIDTWGVDYVLLDKQGREIMPAHSYRDSRTAPFINTIVPFEELYAITGTAKNSFNTVYQLLADRAAGRLDDAAAILFLPEYFSQRLTGNMSAKNHEYTESSTTGLLDAAKREWAWALIDRLGLPARLFRPIRMPPYAIGDLSAAIQAEVGFNASVVMVASHDTASAVSVVPEDALYISSGTWSLLGIQGEPILTEAARKAAYTNEGAANGNIRFLKNIMGLWMIQSVRHELGDQYSFAELEALAKQSALVATPAIIDVNRDCFLNPVSMMSAIADECVRIGARKPETPGDFAHCVYTSLAECYRQAIADLEHITGKTYQSISVIGGGSKDSYLNALTEQCTGKTVCAGPVEATAIGNLMAQIKIKN